MVTELTPIQPAKPKPASVHLYGVTDPIPAAEAVESDSETAWARWEDAFETPSQEAVTSFENTVPGELLSLPSTNKLKRHP